MEGSVLQKTGNQSQYKIYYKTRTLCRYYWLSSPLSSWFHLFAEDSLYLILVPQKGAHDLRELWLQDLAAIKAKQHGGDQSSIYWALLLRERQRTAGRQLRQALGKTPQGGLSYN